MPEGDKTPERRTLLLRQLLDEVSGLPGVRDVSATKLSPTDPPTVAAAAVILAAVALSAGFVPAWRAARLDPAPTLRDE